MEKVQWNEIIELTILTLHVKLLFIMEYLYFLLKSGGLFQFN